MSDAVRPSGWPCPPYSRDAVSLGPFADEPFDLQPLLAYAPPPTGSWRPGAETRWCGAHWLTGALQAAGVRLGTYDRVAVGLLADDGWTTVQVVAGWIARAHDNGTTSSPDAHSRESG